MTKHYVYKGYGITNENGVAHLDHDANGDPINHSYTGVGAGEIDFVASLDDLSDVTIDVNPSTINDTTAGVSHSISATVMDDGSAVQNKSVVFELYKVSDGSLVETLTGVTNSSGEVSVSYVGKDTGSLNIKCRLVSEPCTVFDCPVYDGDNTPTSISWSKTNNAVVTDEVVSLIASVLNTNNNPCINIPVVFKQGNTVLGTAYTDCTGDATITCTWADSDIFNVTAQVGQSLSEDLTMFVKDIEHYTLLWFDKSDANWKVTPNGGQGTSFENGIRTAYDEGNFCIFYANNDVAFTGDWKCEFDLVSFNNPFSLRLYTTSNQATSISNSNATQTSHISIESLNDVIKVFIDETLVNTISSSVGAEIGFRVEQGKTLQFTNFHIYSV